MKISNVLKCRYQDKDIQQIYNKGYKLFDIQESQQYPCYLQLPFDFESIRERIEAKKLNNNVFSLLYKIEFIYYDDFCDLIENSSTEFIYDILGVEGTEDFKKYYLNDDHTIYFQYTIDTSKPKTPYNLYIVAATRNIIIKNNHLDFSRLCTSTISGGEIVVNYCRYIKFNNMLSLEDNSQSIDLSNCFRDCFNLIKIEGLDTIGIKYINNLKYFCYDCYSLEEGISELFTSIENSNVIDFTCAFVHCQSLKSLDLSKLQLASNCNPNAMKEMFRQSQFSFNLTPQIRHFHYNYLTTLEYTFHELQYTGESKNEILDLSNLDFSNIETIRYCFKLISYKQLDLSNSVFTNLKTLEHGFSSDVNLLNVYFPNIQYYYEPFYGSTLYNFDVQTNVWNKANQLRDFRAIFQNCDLTNIDMSTCVDDLIGFITNSSGHSTLHFFYGADIDYINLNNHTFDFDINVLEVYDTIHHELYYKNIQSGTLFYKLLSGQHFDMSTINTLNINNCTFNNLQINIEKKYNDEYSKQIQEIPYYNIIDAIFQGSYNISNYNMNNCVFGEYMVPIFSARYIECINLTYPSPLISSTELTLKPITDEFGNNSWQTWTNIIFDFTSLKEINFQGFIFPNNVRDKVFGYRYGRVSQHGRDIITNSGVGLYNLNIQKINLSYTNISSLILRRLYNFNNSQDYDYHICQRLSEIDISHIDDLNDTSLNNWYFGNVYKIKINNNVLDEQKLKDLLKPGHAPYLSEIDISNITPPSTINPNYIYTFNLFDMDIGGAFYWYYGDNLITEIQDYKGPGLRAVVMDNYSLQYKYRSLEISLAHCFNEINLNTWFNGQFIQHITGIEWININKCDNLESITLLPNNYFFKPYFNFDYNSKLANINFIDTIMLTSLNSLSIVSCGSLDNNAINNIFSHIYIENPNMAVSLDRMFANNLLLSNFDSTLIQTENNQPISLGSGYEMFKNCTSLTNVNLSKFETSKLTDAEGMFSNCSSLTSLDVSNFDTSKIQYFSYMFFNCSSLTSLDVSNFDTSNAKHMHYMFAGCRNLTSLDVSNFDISNFEKLLYPNYISLNEDSSELVAMFADCTSLTNLKMFAFHMPDQTLQTWKYYRINLNEMFQNCSSLTQLDLKGFYFFFIENPNQSDSYEKHYVYGTIMRNTFKGCTNLKTIYVNKLDKPFISDQDYTYYHNNTFDGCESLEGGAGTTYQNMKQEFPGQYKDISVFGRIDEGELNRGYFTYKSFD